MGATAMSHTFAPLWGPRPAPDQPAPRAPAGYLAYPVYPVAVPAGYPVLPVQPLASLAAAKPPEPQQPASPPQQPARCHCAVDELLAPIRSKMKALKKLKKRMGLAPRSGNSSSTANNLPPILFHQVHGENITLCNGGSVARRSESFCKGVTFSNRPIKIGERVCLKFLEISDNWSGVIRFGFTSYDPSTLRAGLPRYACPDLTNKPGYWAKALSERFAEQDLVLHYYVTQAGDVHFGINGEDRGFFFNGVETRGPLWALVDVYGNSTAIELVDPRGQLNNSRRSLTVSESASDVDRLVAPMAGLGVHHTPAPAPAPAPAAAPVPAAVTAPPLQSGPPALPAPNNPAAPGPHVGHHHDDHLPSPRFQPSGAVFNHLAFHRTRGRNVRLSNDRTLAQRADTEFCHGYVFTQRPVILGERIVIQVLNTEPAYVGALAFGLTSCDPATLQPSDLPDDADLLLDRSEYWVVSKDVASSPQRGDELTFSVTHSGEVQISRNGGTPVVFMHVDQTLQLWAFLDVYGSTQRIRLLGSLMESTSHRDRDRALRVSLPLPLPHHSAVDPHVANNQNNGRAHPYPASTVVMTPPAPAPAPAPPPVPPHGLPLSQAQPSVGPSPVPATQAAMLVVSLPPNSHSYHAGPHPIAGPSEMLASTTSATLLSSRSDATYIEPVSATSTYSTVDSSVQQWADTRMNTTTSSDCSICYERTIDSVLYMCGHMCMCYECAVQQWRGKGGGHCPLCRAVIRDVIRIYKS